MIPRHRENSWTDFRNDPNDRYNRLDETVSDIFRNMSPDDLAVLIAQYQRMQDQNSSSAIEPLMNMRDSWGGVDPVPSNPNAIPPRFNESGDGSLRPRRIPNDWPRDLPTETIDRERELAQQRLKSNGVDPIESPYPTEVLPADEIPTEVLPAPQPPSFMYGDIRLTMQPDGRWFAMTHDEFHQPQIFEYSPNSSQKPGGPADPIRDMMDLYTEQYRQQLEVFNNRRIDPNHIPDQMNTYPTDTYENGFEEGGVSDPQLPPEGRYPLDLGLYPEGFMPQFNGGEGAAAGLGGVGPLSGVARDSAANDFYQNPELREWIRSNMGDDMLSGIDSYYGYDPNTGTGHSGGEPLPRDNGELPPDVDEELGADEQGVKAFDNGLGDPNWWEQDDGDDPPGHDGGTPLPHDEPPAPEIDEQIDGETPPNEPTDDEDPPAHVND